MKKAGLLIMMVYLLSSFPVMAGQKVVALKTDTQPVIDGIADDAAWKSAPTVTTKDTIANISIELQAVYTDEEVFIKVRFPDTTENREHKTLVWNSDLEVYRTGTKREDSFVLKWSMEPVPVALNLQSDKAYKADIWFWKAFRTGTVGYADDKFHIYGAQEMKKSRQISLPSGKKMFLTRLSDEGTSTYKSIAYEQFAGDTAARYKHRHPSGSRADIHAKGHWSDGFWTIEFQRKLMTGNTDDVQLNPSLSYDFGVSRYEIAGKSPNPKLEQPNYESGDIGEILTLSFH